MNFRNLTLLLILLTCILWYGDMKTSTAAVINATITPGVFVPQKPVNLAVTIDDLSVDLSWSIPISDGGSTILDYIIEYKLTSSGTWSIFNDGVSTNTYVTIGSLSNDNSYDFRVSAVNGIGQGPASSEVSATPGSPAQVLISGFSDLSTPSVVASVRITNEGSDAYEYQYTWCVTDSDANLCGGGDDVFSSTAAKLIQASENWDTSLATVLNNEGNYWFHVKVAFGSDSSYASQSFTATTESSGGGGGSSSSRRSSTKTSACIGADINKDKLVNLVDFSILLMFFNTTGPFTNSCVDINRDNKVSVIDFSIMLTQWGKKPTPFISPLP